MKFITRKFLLALFINVTCMTVSHATGINFETQSNWTTIREKAKKERKYIFIEVGATWCIPCHIMENTVLNQENVGAFFNAKFINVKVQADKTGKDNDFIKSWYADASEIIKDYNVGAFPSYLYLSPEGTLVYRTVGVMSIDEFLSTASNAFDPKLNLAMEKESFQKKEMDLALEGLFATKLYKLGDYQAADSVALDYKSRYLENSAPKVLKDSANLNFIVQFQKLVKLNDRCFNLFNSDGREVDSLLKIKGFSHDFTNRIITRVFVWKALYDARGKVLTDAPAWNSIENAISNQFLPERAHEIVLPEKYQFYCTIKNWSKACESGIDLVENGHLNKPDVYATVVNEVAYNTLFKYSDNKNQLNKAVKWIAPLLKSKPDDYAMLDTYSCLLYKLGRKKEALVVERNAIAKVQRSQQSQSNKDFFLENFNGNLKKMMSGAATWD